MKEWDTTLQFLPTTDTKPLEKMSGRRKKLWIGLGLLFLAVAVALMTGLLVWHYNGEHYHPTSTHAIPRWDTMLTAPCLSRIWNITKIGPLTFSENFMKTLCVNLGTDSSCHMTSMAQVLINHSDLTAVKAESAMSLL